MKQWGKYFEQAMTKEERDEWEKNRLFRNRYRDTFDAIGCDGSDYENIEEEEE